MTDANGDKGVEPGVCAWPVLLAMPNPVAPIAPKSSAQALYLHVRGVDLDDMIILILAAYSSTCASLPW